MDADNFFERRRLVRDFVDCITVYQDYVDVHFKLHQTPLDLNVSERIAEINKMG